MHLGFLGQDAGDTSRLRWDPKSQGRGATLLGPREGLGAAFLSFGWIGAGGP